MFSIIFCFSEIAKVFRTPGLSFDSTNKKTYLKFNNVESSKTRELKNSRPTEVVPSINVFTASSNSAFSVTSLALIRIPLISLCDKRFIPILSNILQPLCLVIFLY